MCNITYLMYQYIHRTSGNAAAAAVMAGMGERTSRVGSARRGGGTRKPRMRVIERVGRGRGKAAESSGVNSGARHSEMDPCR